MSEQATYRTERLDHLGIVAGICQEIELIERVDILVGEDDRKVSVGQAVQAMVQCLSDEALVDTYKGQNTTVERGFRFPKDPLFFAHSLFLKKPERIMALLMVMGLYLLVYALAEHRLRSELGSRDETLPDQAGTPTQRITLRRVFQMFEGIDILLLAASEHQQRLILNLTDVHQRILELLGRYVQQCYFQTP